MGSIIGIAVAAAAAAWVYTDAKKNQMDKTVLYTVLTFFIWIIGLPVYLVARSNHQKRLAAGPQGQLPPQ